MQKTYSKSKPISHQLRKIVQAKVNKTTTTNYVTSILSIDEQIALLEQNSESESETESDNDAMMDESIIVEKDENGQIVKFLSSIEVDEKIAPLSKELLPGVACSTTKKYSKPSPALLQKSNKRIRFTDDSNNPNNNSVRSGMEATVKELLRHYEPASLEKRPFWCRVCKFQGLDTAQLEEHRLSEFHLLASEMERKASFCKLCRKQFTSPDQLKEHLVGKAHAERLTRAKDYQLTNKRFC